MRAALDDACAQLDLPALGWTLAARSAPDELLANPEARPARVRRVDRGRSLLVAFGGEPPRHVRDRVPGDVPTVVGDWVLVDAEPPDGGGLGLARVRLPRRGVLARRRDTASTAPQVLAANVDLVLVAEALDPDRTINVGRTMRFVAIAAAGDIDVRVVLTNADRVTDDPPVTVAGVPTIASSIVDGRGLDELRSLLGSGTTATIVGPSGAGKSSLVNALAGTPLLAVGERRATGTGTGRHTTSSSRLVPLPSGALLVDTPGIRVVGMHADVDVSAVASGEFAELAEQCRFDDCAHDTEPGCAVADAVERGELPPDAVKTWQKLQREALREQARADVRLRRELNSERMSAARGYTKARRRGEYPERRS